MTAAPIIVTHSLSRTFGSLVAVRDVSLRVHRGEIFGVLGPNGAGKSTTLRMLCGILDPSGGSGTVVGFDIRTQAEEIKKRIGYMTQRFSLYEDLSVVENLRFYAGIYGLSGRTRRLRVEHSIERTGLSDRRKQIAGTLSGGWKQRLALACATIHEPPLLFLDEPTAGVDPVSRRDFWDQIHRLATEGTTVLVTTHYMDEAERCHRLAFIFGGRVLAVGRPDAIVARHGIRLTEAEVADQAVAVRTLRALPEVDQVSAYGPMLRVATMGLEHPAERIAAELGAAGVQTVSVREGRATVEDTFVSMVHRQDGAPAHDVPAEASADETTDAPTDDNPTEPSEPPRRAFGAAGVTRLLALARKELLQLRRDRLTAAMMAVLPVVQLLLFGYAINTDVRHMSLVVYDQDASRASRDLTRTMIATGYYDLVGHARSYENVQRALRNGSARVALVVPAQFGSDLTRGRDVAVQLLVDGTDPQTVGSATLAASGVVADRGAQLTRSRMARVLPSLAFAGLRLETSVLFNPDQRTAIFIVPGLVGVILTMTMVMLTAMAIARERERGTLEQLIVSPVRRFELIAGKIAPYVLIGYVQMTLILMVGNLVFGVPIGPNVRLLYALALVFIAANLALGLLFSTMARTQQQAMQMSFFFLLPNILLSGFMFPFEGMPRPAQALSSALPLTHFMRIVRAIILKSADYDDVRIELHWMVGILVVLLVASSLRFSKKLG